MRGFFAQTADVVRRLMRLPALAKPVLDSFYRVFSHVAI